MNNRAPSTLWPMVATLVLHFLVLCGLILGVHAPLPPPQKPVVVELWQAPAPALGQPDGGRGEGGTGLKKPEPKPRPERVEAPVEPQPAPVPEPVQEQPKPVVVEKPIKPTVEPVRQAKVPREKPTREKPIKEKPIKEKPIKEKPAEKRVDIAIKPPEPIQPKEKKKPKKPAVSEPSKKLPLDDKPKRVAKPEPAKADKPKTDKRQADQAKPASQTKVSANAKPKPANASAGAAGDGKKPGNPKATSDGLLGRVNGALDGKGSNPTGKGQGEGTAAKGVDKDAAANKFVKLVNAGIKSRVHLSETYPVGTKLSYRLTFADAGGGRVKLLPNYVKAQGSGIDALDEDVEKALEKLRTTSFELPEGLTLTDVRGRAFTYRVE